MENGIYHAVLSSHDGCANGVMVVAEGVVNGGGSGYWYQGALATNGAALSGDVTIRKWDAAAPAALGMFKDVALAVSGKYDPETRSFRFEGRANGHHVIRIQATGRYLTALA